MANVRPNNLESLWMPFTANREFKKDPRIITGAKGMYYYSDDGREILDSAAGLWASNLSHCRKEIQEAVSKQLEVLDYSPPFQFSHPGAHLLANRLTQEIFPEKMNHVFFSNSGSEAVESGLKIALAYQKSRGMGSKTRFLSSEMAYHGTNGFGTATGGMKNNRRHYSQLVNGVDHVPNHYNQELNAYSRGQPKHGKNLAEDLEKLIQLHHADSIAAFIIEPVKGSAGVFPPPVGYLERIREICTQHDILLIFDETITAFGRLGKATASEYFNITPDIITCAKAITNATVPMGATICQDYIYESVVENSKTPIELFHGYTYSSHNLACASAIACLDIYKNENIFEYAAKMAPLFEEAVHSLKGTKHVMDIRNLGLMASVQLEEIEGAPGKRGFNAMKKCWENGLYVRFNGSTAAFSPPLVLKESHIDEMFSKFRKVLEQLD